MTPSFREDDISQIPALLILQAMGYKYLTPAEALQLRGGRTSSILLEEVLRQQIHQNNSFRYKDRAYPFSETNVSNAIYALQDYPLQEGFMASNIREVCATASFAKVSIRSLFKYSKPFR